MRDRIKFLGTAGARFVMIKQLRSSAGTWITLEDKNLLLDPGPGTLVRCAKSRPPLDPTKLDAIILSHQHIDHASDVNIMIEAMTNGGYSKKGVLFAPRSALEDDPIVLKYVREYLNEVHVLEEGSRYAAGEVEISAPLRHVHPVETYGIVFKTPKYAVSFIVDTRFFPDLIKRYKKSDLIVINVVRANGKWGKKLDVDHLNIDDVKKVIKGISPRQAILTHFGFTMVRAKPWQVAAEVEEETGIKTIAAGDGMEFDLEKELA
ncbi:MAG: MBL fold metallo-hydrolase [candidate division Zixibacteria bacterium]|nr:MBL fold metallo-hydrolase [candidate division Zixibacteria bacterium]